MAEPNEIEKTIKGFLDKATDKSAANFIKTIQESIPPENVKVYESEKEFISKLMEEQFNNSPADLQTAKEWLEKILRPAIPAVMFEEMIKYDCTDNPEEAFTPETLNGFRFDKATVTTIGARPGTGKTALLDCLALDALLPGKGKKPHKVLFITAEETPVQIHKRFLLCLYRRLIDKNLEQIHLRDPYFTIGGLTEYKEFTEPRDFIGNPIFGVLPRNVMESIEKRIFQELVPPELKDRYQIMTTKETGDLVNHAIVELTNLTKNRALQVVDADSANVDLIVKYMEQMEPGSVVLIDYEQILQPSDNQSRTATTARNLEVGEISHLLTKTAKAKDLILINASQLNRPARGTTSRTTADSDRPEELTLDRLGESDKIGNDSYNVIMLGKQKTSGEDEPAKYNTFYKVVKHRNGADLYEKYQLETDLGFYYMKGNGEKFVYAETNQDKAPGKQGSNKDDDIGAGDNYDWDKATK